MLRKKQNISVGCLPEFDMFSIPNVQSSIECDYEAEYRPVATLDPKSFIEFNLNTDVQEYLRLHKTEFYLRMKISIAKNGNDEKCTLEDWKNISTCNNLLNSLFKQVEFWIGDRLIDPPHQTYPYKTYFEKILGKSSDIKKTSATLGFWTEDIPEDPEALIKEFSDRIKPDANSSNMNEGKEFELLGKIHLPMFEQRHQALLGGCKLKIKFIPNDPSFYIKCNSNIRVKNVEFTECYLTIKGVKVHPSVAHSNEIALNNANARYFLLDNFVIPYTINKGGQDITLDNVYDGYTPNRIFVAFVDHRSFNGSNLLNPYNFQHFGINYLSIYMNGTPAGGLPKTPNFKTGWYSKEYYDLFEVTNQDNIDTCISITKDQFEKGFNIFSFRCQPDLICGGARSMGFVNPLKPCSMRLHFRFDEPLDRTITALIYFDFDTLLQITKTRNVIYDHS